MDPQLLELCLTFYTATALWLVELVKGERESLYPLPDEVCVAMATMYTAC